MEDGVDFTDLNKACSKDSYPLPSIDALVNNASGCRLLSFLDAFSGYNQIMMHPRDECKTSFMTELSVEQSGVQALKNPNPLKDVEALAVLGVAVLV